MEANPYQVLFGSVDERRPCLRTVEAGSRERGWTYGEVAEASAALAGALVELGVATGDRVLVQVDKSAESIALYLACLRLGIVHVPVNTAYTPVEVDTFAQDAEPALFVGHPDAPPVAGAAHHLTLDTRGGGTLADRARAATPQRVVVPRGDDDWAAMLYTSGTTGRAKGAMLSCRNLTSNAAALAEAWHFRPDDVLVHVLPTFHVHGLFVALHCAFAVGAEIRLHPRFDVDAVIDDLPGATVFMGVPTHYHRLLGSPRLGPGATTTMRLFTSGSAPLPAHEHEAFRARTGHAVVERYGMTETMILTSNPHDGERVAGTVGYPLPGVEVRVTGDDGAVLDTGETGGVEVRTPGLFLGYWRRPEATAEARTPDGWFRTGDLGSLDDTGRLTLAGRAGDMILTGGLNVYPKEIELVLDQVPGVDESAVVGVPDADFGEAVVAVVACREPVADADLAAACDTHLARFKHPRRYLRVDSLPRNAMGKVVKAELRRLVAEPGDLDR